jgi:hypothetical protein
MSEDRYAEFRLTDAELARLAAAPFQSDASHWAEFAARFEPYILEGYSSGEMELEEAIRVMRQCALGCDVLIRLMLLGMFVERGLAKRPKSLNRKRPPYPEWLKGVELEPSRHVQRGSANPQRGRGYRQC